MANPGLDQDYDFDVSYEMLAAVVNDPEPSDRRKKVIWAAGFFDGEGSISIARRKNRRGPYFRVLVARASQTTEEPLNIFVDLWGGTVAWLYKRDGNRKPIAQWVVSARLAEGALREMLPYLVVKKERALIGLEFQSRRTKSSRRGVSDMDADVAAEEKMRRLNARGLSGE